MYLWASLIPSAMKTHSRLLISLIVLLGGLCAVAAPDDSNVRIDSRIRTIDLEARDGSVVKAKVSDEETFSTRRGDGRGHMAVLYDDVFSRIVSASAPGTKAIYRAWEQGDLFYSGGRICYLPVQIKSGRTAKATVKSVYDAPEFMSVIYIPEQDYEVGRSEVIVNIPREVCDKVHITGRNLPANATETWEETPRGKRYVLRVDSLAGYTGEPNSASASASLPRLLINTRFENLSDFYSYLHSKAGAAKWTLR